MKVRILALTIILFAIALACKKETYELDKFSKQTDIKINLAGPILKGSFTLSDFIENQDNKNDLLVIDGDTVKFHIIRDSILKYNKNDLSVIPTQIGATYISQPDNDIHLTGFGDTIIQDLVVDTNYILELKNSMRLDSLYLNSGNLIVNTLNSFSYPTDVRISSTSIFDQNNNPLFYSVTLDPNNNSLDYINLAGYKIVFGHTVTNQSTVQIKFTPVVHKDGSNSVIHASDKIDINFDVTDLNDFKLLFGFVGYFNTSYDTVVNFSIEGMDKDILNKITGTFQATKPKIKFNYIQSFGVPIGTDINCNIYHGVNQDANIDLLPKMIPQVAYHTDPPLKGNLIFSSADGINELISFPLADSLHIIGNMMTNMGKDSLTTFNFVKNNSETILGLDVEVPLEFKADLTYTDTLKTNWGNDIQKVQFEYLNLHYWFSNGFPLGFDLTLYVYDSINQQIIDTIDLNLVSGEPFLKAAPVDPNGVVLQSQVKEIHGYTSLDHETGDNLFKHATHFIIKAVLQTYNVNSVKILQNSNLKFQFGIEAEGDYIKGFDPKF